MMSRYNDSIFSLVFLGLLAGCSPVTYRPTTECVVKESYIHRYGIEVPEESWSSSGQSGKVVRVLATGVTMTETYLDGLLDGEVTYTFPHDQTIQKVAFYRVGTLLREEEHYPSGIPMKELLYDSPTQQTVKLWYESGSPRAIEVYKDNLLQQGEYYSEGNHLEAKVGQGKGTRYVRDPYGILLSIDTIDAGELVSKSTFYSNGSPQAIIPYSHGVVDGLRKTFLPGGEPNLFEQWVNGMQEGITFVYHNGEKVAEVPYSRGLKEGIEKRYRNNGTIVVEEISWKKGKQHGPAYSYVEGTTQAQWFYQGNVVSKILYDQLCHL